MAFSPNRVQLNNLMTSFVNGDVSVGTSAIELIVGASMYSGRTVIAVTPTDGTIYVGDENVTVSNGTPIQENETTVFLLKDTQSLYGIASSTIDVRVIEGKT